MATIQIHGDSLVVAMHGFDKVLALKSTVTIPLEHVLSVEQNLAEASAVWHGFKIGTGIPGVLTAGSFFSKGEWTFWDVRDPAQAVIIRLAHEHYSRLVVGVDDPQATLRLTRQALAALAEPPRTEPPGAGTP